MDVELRQLRYFVAVAEELHFGRAAERLHMSQSPLSRAIRDLERQLEVTLFVRTTRRVELTPAGRALLARARRALAEVDGALDGAREARAPSGPALGVGFGPLSRRPAARLARALGAGVRLVEGVTPELLAKVAAGELAAAAVLETPAAARRHGVRIEPLRDEPLLAALPATHPAAGAGVISLEDFVAECVMLPREQPGAAFNPWLRAVLRAHGHELDRTMEMLSAPWDPRMRPVAAGEAVSVIVGDWVDPPIDGVVALALDPPITMPIDLATPLDGADHVVAVALGLRDRADWLTVRAASVRTRS